MSRDKDEVGHINEGLKGRMTKITESGIMVSMSVCPLWSSRV